MPATVSEPNARCADQNAPSIRVIGPGLAVAIAVGTGLLLRASKGYRPFPSIDDFIYIPHARASLDAGLFTRDTLVQELVGHVPLWPVLIRGLESTIGLEHRTLASNDRSVGCHRIWNVAINARLGW